MVNIPSSLSFKAILLFGIGAVVSALITGYFYSAGTDLWQLTKAIDLSSPMTGFWFISVPLGIIGILLLIIAVKKWYDPLARLPFYHAVDEAEDMLKASKKEFWVLGTTLAHWSEVKRTDVIKAIVKRKIHCRFVLSKPNSEFVEASKLHGIIAKETNEGEIQQKLDYFVKYLKNDKELKDEKLQDNIEIRTFNLPFLYSMVVCDASDDNGVIYVEPYSYDTIKGDRFLLVIRKREQPKLFELYLKSFEYVWDKAKKSVR